MLYVLIGKDDFSLNESLEEIKRGLGDRSLLATNTSTLDGQQLTPDQLRTVCSAIPFLSPKRLVIVEGLLGRFEPKIRQKKKGNNNQKSDCRAFATLPNECPNSTILVFKDGEVKNSNPLLKELLFQAKVKSFPLLRNEKLRQWIKKRVQKEGGSISLQAVDLLARLVGSNLWVMSSEISKLVLFTSNCCIEEEDVMAVVGYAQQTNVFNMVDAIIDFKSEQAQQAIQQLLQMGISPAYLLFMLSRQARMLVRTKEMIKTGKSEVEIQDRLSLVSEFAWHKIAKQASYYSLERLKDLYHKLLAADISIKTGKYEPELVLNILVAELCQ